MADYTARHPSTQGLMAFLQPNQKIISSQPISTAVYDLAVNLVDMLTDGPELTAGLRKLLEAKDCFARQYVAMSMEKCSCHHELAWHDEQGCRVYDESDRRCQCLVVGFLHP